MKSSSGFGCHYEPFTKASVNGYLHSPFNEREGDGIVLTHGAGGDCTSPLLIAVASALAMSGFHVLRFDLAFRKSKRPPHPSRAREDRESLKSAAEAMRHITGGKLILGGHSYGGRQASMLAAEDASVADSLLLLSYPLHPPLKPDALRTEHLSNLSVPCLFVHGTKDLFGSQDEMRAALQLIPSQTELSVVEGAGHDLKRGRFDIQELIGSKLPSAR